MTYGIADEPGCAEKRETIIMVSEPKSAVNTKSMFDWGKWKCQVESS